MTPAHGKTLVRILFILLGCLVLVSPAGDADARRRRRSKPRTMNPQEKRARQIFAEAEKQYNLGRFKKALALYSRAYEVMPLPGFLFNIGQCHRMMKNYERAIFFYTGYLRGGKNVPNRAAVERLIADSERRLKEQKKKEERARRLAAKNAGGPGPEAIKRAQAAAAARAATSGKPFVPGARKKRPVHKKAWFWTTIGIGAALIIGAVVGGTLYALRDESSGFSFPETTLGTLNRR